MKIEDFLQQDEELEAFITGPAGSGKSTDLKDIIATLDQLKVNYLVTAYTHKAKDVLSEKLPHKTPIKTLHSFLKKRPGINSKAKHIKAIMTNSQMGKPDTLQLLIIDEFSFVGEKDYMSIGDLQDELLLTEYHCEKCGTVEVEEMTCVDCRGRVSEIVTKPLKVLYVGDLNQLSPIGGPPAVEPHEPFWLKLTEIYRTNTTLSEPLSKLVDMIEGREPMKYLKPTKHFLRNGDIDDLYIKDTEDKVMLAFTNLAVQNHNISIMGRRSPQPGDLINIPTLKTKLYLKNVYNEYYGSLQTVNGIISKGTKYNPVEYLNNLNYIKFYEFTNGFIVAGIFGSFTNKQIRDKLGKKLVAANKDNKNSKAIYREYKTINDYVSVMDFDHCMTIHKSQGQEYDHVYIDSKDLYRCIDKQERMKLLYVAMSRAKSLVILNN